MHRAFRQLCSRRRSRPTARKRVSTTSSTCSPAGRSPSRGLASRRPAGRSGRALRVPVHAGSVGRGSPGRGPAIAGQLRFVVLSSSEVVVIRWVVVVRWLPDPEAPHPLQARHPQERRRRPVATIIDEAERGGRATDGLTSGDNAFRGRAWRGSGRADRNEENVASPPTNATASTESVVRT